MSLVDGHACMLPVINRECTRYELEVSGQAQINLTSVLIAKYFRDLPQGTNQPVQTTDCRRGCYAVLADGTRDIGIERLHLEQASMHDQHPGELYRPEPDRGY